MRNPSSARTYATVVARGRVARSCRLRGAYAHLVPLGYRFHASRHAFEADVARRRRSNHVAYTYGDVFERGARTAAEIAALLR
jgi:hypothetical protein